MDTALPPADPAGGSGRLLEQGRDYHRSQPRHRRRRPRSLTGRKPPPRKERRGEAHVLPRTEVPRRQRGDQRGAAPRRASPATWRSATAAPKSTTSPPDLPPAASSASTGGTLPDRRPGQTPTSTRRSPNRSTSCPERCGSTTAAAGPTPVPEISCSPPKADPRLSQRVRRVRLYAPALRARRTARGVLRNLRRMGAHRAPAQRRRTRRFHAPPRHLLAMTCQTIQTRCPGRAPGISPTAAAVATLRRGPPAQPPSCA